MTIQEAIKNVSVVVSQAKLNFDENAIMRESLTMIINRCKLADELEQEKTDGKSKT